MGQIEPIFAGGFFFLHPDIPKFTAPIIGRDKTINLDTWTWAGGVMLSFAILAMSLTDLLANIIPEEEV